MTYYITNNLGSIKIVGDNAGVLKEFYVAKWAVKSICLIRDNIIMVDTLDSGSRDSPIIFNYKDVVIPTSPSADVLIYTMTGWLNSWTPPETGS